MAKRRSDHAVLLLTYAQFHAQLAQSEALAEQFCRENGLRYCVLRDVHAMRDVLARQLVREGFDEKVFELNMRDDGSMETTTWHKTCWI